MRARQRPIVKAAAGVLFAAILLAACSNSPVEEPAPTVVVEPSKRTFALGDTLYVTLSNLRDRDVTYSLCKSTLQRWTAPTGWYDVIPAGFPVVCADIADQLPRHQTSAPRWVLLRGAGNAGHGNFPSTLATGTYRIVVPEMRDAITGATLSLLNRASGQFELQ